MEEVKADRSTRKIYCSGCTRFFASNSDHADHRTGDYSTRTSRRCRTDEEMRSRGMDTEKKNVRIIVEGKETYQEHDVWFNVAGREAVRARFAGYGEED